jgi:hypothetical protein
MAIHQLDLLFVIFNPPLRSESRGVIPEDRLVVVQYGRIHTYDRTGS